MGQENKGEDVRYDRYAQEGHKTLLESEEESLDASIKEDTELTYKLNSWAKKIKLVTESIASMHVTREFPLPSVFADTWFRERLCQVSDKMHSTKNLALSNYAIYGGAHIGPFVTLVEHHHIFFLRQDNLSITIGTDHYCITNL